MQLITRHDWIAAFRLGCLSFGGPAGQIALMHREMVSEQARFSEREFTDALSFCMFLPGPEALQLAIFLGWKRHGWRGGVLAGCGFLLPGVAMMLALACALVRYQSLAPVLALLAGLKMLAVALVCEAVLRLSSKALVTNLHRGIAALAMVALGFRLLPYPLVIGLAALGGALWATDLSEPVAVDGYPRWRDGIQTVVIGLVVWLVFSGLIYVFEVNPLLWRLHVFFSQVALAGFGGAYAVIEWVRESLVNTGATLQDADWVTGLALTETTPGPLVLVLPFYGFLGLFRATTDVGLALLGGILLTVSVFLPSFVLVIGLGRYLDVLRTNQRLVAALHGVTAAVLGVIAIFALHLTLSICWIKQSQQVNVLACVGVALFFAAYRWLKWPLTRLVMAAIIVPMTLQYTGMLVFGLGQ